MALSSKDEIAQAGDTAHGVVDTAALEPAVTGGFPGLRPGGDALHSCTDLLA